MSRSLETIRGKQFVHPVTKESYGLFRLSDTPVMFSTLDGQQLAAIAGDDSGNYLTQMQDGSVWFWDHETDSLVKLAISIPEFVAGCTELSELPWRRWLWNATLVLMPVWFPYVYAG